MQYARSQSDITLKQKGLFEDNIRLNRRQRRKQKDGNTDMHSNIYRTEEAPEEREVTLAAATVDESTQDKGGDDEIVPYNPHSEYSDQLQSFDVERVDQELPRSGRCSIEQQRTVCVGEV